MQVFRLVSGGRVDRLIGFDELPKELLKGVTSKRAFGLPKSWSRWLESVGSVVEKKYEVDMREELPNGEFKIIPRMANECFPGFYVLEPTGLNADKEKWGEICSYVQRNVDPSSRLMDKIEDMARPMAPDPNSAEIIDPEDIPVISIKARPVLVSPSGDEILTEKDVQPVAPVAEAPKKRGRPKKVAVA